MGPFVVTQPVVKETLTGWFIRSGEVLVELYLPHSGGGGHFYVLTDYSQYEDLMARAKPGSVSLALRVRQLPIRGNVDERLISWAVQYLDERGPYVIAEPGHYPAPLTFLAVGDTLGELKADLEKFRGSQVWLGPDFPMPNEFWKENASQDVLIATKPRTE